VRVEDVTGQLVTYALWGPRSRDLLRGLTGADLTNAAFPFMTAQEISVADVPVRALRVTFTGELGWELYAPAEYGLGLWTTLWEAGREHGLVAGGYRAIESLRLEKGYRVWSTDITPETDAVRGRPGLLREARQAGRLRGTRGAGRGEGAGGCPDGSAASRWPTGARWRSAASRCGSPARCSAGSPPAASATPWTRRSPTRTCPSTVATTGTEVEVNVFGEWVAGAVCAQPLVDPKGTRHPRRRLIKIPLDADAPALCGVSGAHGVHFRGRRPLDIPGPGTVASTLAGMPGTS
jgi:4-methylaminobutanoate oxidase (formaldehyde-forming)